MKYALIIVFALIIVRIDMFVGVAERAWEKLPTWQRSTSQSNESPSDMVSTLSVNKLKQDNVSQLQVLFTEFSYNADKSTRELISSYVKNSTVVENLNPTILYNELDKWRPKVGTENTEQLLVLNDLITIFKNLNEVVVQQFYSLYFEESPEFFFHYYPSSKDPNCMVAKYVWNMSNSISAEQIILRQNIIENLKGKIPQDKLGFAHNCQLVLRVEISKINQATESP